MKKINEESEDFCAEDRIEFDLLKHHVHFLSGDIDEDSIDKAIKWIVFEHLSAKENEQKVLTLYINSDGGYLSDAFALIDIMRQSKFTIQTIGLGSIASAAFLIFASGTKGHRYIAPNTSIMCHQFSDSVEGKYHDLKAQMREGELTNQKMVNLLLQTTNLDAKQIRSKLLTASDVWLTPDEMKKYGIADHYLT